MIRRLLCALALIPAVAFAAQAPDTSVVTGPNFQQLPLANSLVTPDGGTQTTLGAALAGGALPQIPTLNVLGNVSGSSTTPVAVPLDNSTLITSGGKLQVNTGTSGATVPLNNGNNTQSGAWTFGANTTTFGGNAAAPIVHINGAAGSVRGFEWDAAGVTRWQFQTDASDDLNLYSYATNGAFVDTPFSIFNTTKQIHMKWALTEGVTSSPASGGIVGDSATYNNVGGNNAQGSKRVYFSNAVTAGFDISEVSGLIPTATSGFPTSGNGITFQGKWLYALSPVTTSAFAPLTGFELDVMNREQDWGWSRTIASTGAIGNYLAVPESNTLGQGGPTYNALFAFDAHASAAPGTSGLTNRYYNDFICEPNSEVGGTGRCFYATGDITGLAAQYPYGPFQADGTWLHGFDTTAAKFADYAALRMAAGQQLAWPSGGGWVSGSPAGSVNLEYATASGEIDLRDAQANVRTKMTATTVDLGVAATGANLRVGNSVSNLVITDLASWGTGSPGSGVTDNAAVAPDGTTTAALLSTFVGSASQIRFRNLSSATNGALYSLTVHVASQPGTNFPFVMVTLSGAGFGAFTPGIVANTNTCAFTANAYGNPSNAPVSFQVVSDGNGWCRVSVQVRAVSASTPYTAAIHNSNGSTDLFTGDGTGIYVWQPVAEVVPENFITATGAAAGATPTLSTANSGDTNANLGLSAKGAGVIAALSPVQLPVFTVATLPSCAAGNTNALVAVSDATSPTYNGTLTGSGAVHVPAFCNGSAWVSH